MSAAYVLYAATFLYVSAALPDIYATYKNKNSNIYNLFDKGVLLTACSLGMTYGILTNNTPIIINYAPSVFLDALSLSLRLYYASKNGFEVEPIKQVEYIEDCTIIVAEVDLII